jgi:hypothetical protein
MKEGEPGRGVLDGLTARWQAGGSCCSGDKASTAFTEIIGTTEVVPFQSGLTKDSD